MRSRESGAIREEEMDLGLKGEVAVVTGAGGVAGCSGRADSLA